MKLFLSLTFLCIITLLSTVSCSKSLADQAASEVCECIEGIKLEDPATAMIAIGCMGKIIQNEEYKQLTEDEVAEAFKRQCPDTYEAIEKWSKLSN